MINKKITCDYSKIIINYLNINIRIQKTENREAVIDKKKVSKKNNN
jgi:hypothetical protein